MTKTIFLLLSLTSICFSQQTTETPKTKKIRQETIFEEFYTNCAKKYYYSYEMSEWQNCLDQGLKKDSTIAGLWHEKAMPYFKAKKYEVGMKFIDKAVLYEPTEQQPYRAFIKCIFAKTYKDAIIDFEDCTKKFGNLYVMDHTFGFYIGLCYLQLNEYKKAEKQFKDYNDDIFKNRQGLEHPTALFYHGIAKFELKKWTEAIEAFDKALKIYPQFSDAKYYKMLCMYKLGLLQKGDWTKMKEEAKADAEKGYTINEDNTIYETYPYQKKWKD